MSNILFISPNPIWGGAATANLAIAKMLQDNGHHIIYNDEYANISIYNGVNIDKTPIHQKKFSDRTLLTDIIRRNNINCVVWSPLAATYFYNEIKRYKEKGIKQIAIVHSLSLTKDLKGRMMDYLVSLTLSRMTTIVFVSKYTMDSWNNFKAVRKSKANKIVIHNLVDITPRQHSVKKNKVKIGFVGRLSEEKQPNVFCDLSSDSQFTFSVYGNGPLLENLKSKYSSVEFKGHCSNIDKIYSDIDILVMTSKFENCPMVILESQAYGIPCIAPNVGGIPEIVTPGVNGILYDDYDTKTILLAINKIIAEYSKYSTACVNTSEKHAPKSTISQWEKIL